MQSYCAMEGARNGEGEGRKKSKAEVWYQRGGYGKEKGDRKRIN